ncbi:MAG: hypothetical protein V1752_05245 [Candidatus Firestonebacteria bacterium]
MPEKCKGAGLRISIYKCPQCFETVEVFSDEKKATCTYCGSIIFVETSYKCMEWCASAGVCMAKTIKRQIRSTKVCPGRKRGKTRKKRKQLQRIKR